VRDRQTKESAPPDVIKRVVDFCRRNGVLVGRSGGGRHLGNTIQLSPPLVITRPEIDHVVSILDRALAELGSPA
jgi:taurine-pyruvate aminotransferase